MAMTMTNKVTLWSAVIGVAGAVVAALILVLSGPDLVVRHGDGDGNIQCVQSKCEKP